MSDFKVYHTQRNKWFVIVKNWPLGFLMRHLPVILFFDAAALFLAVLKGRGDAALRARRDVLKNLERLLAKRREVQLRSKLSPGEIERFFSPYEGAFKTFFRKVNKR